MLPAPTNAVRTPRAGRLMGEARPLAFASWGSMFGECYLGLFAKCIPQGRPSLEMQFFLEGYHQRWKSSKGRQGMREVPLGLWINLGNCRDVSYSKCSE